MNSKQKIKMCIDLAMTMALPILMCYSPVGEKTHEIIGVAYVLPVYSTSYPR